MQRKVLSGTQEFVPLIATGSIGPVKRMHGSQSIEELA
jgi:hypothetical protein